MAGLAFFVNNLADLIVVFKVACESNFNRGLSKQRLLAAKAMIRD